MHNNMHVENIGLPENLVKSNDVNSSGVKKESNKSEPRHYNIAAYCSLFEVADVLGYFKIAEMLHRASEGREVIDKPLIANSFK